MQVLERFRGMLDISVDAAASLLGTSARTLARRQKEGHLQETESDRLYRIVRLFERAVEVFGNKEDARMWMRLPQWGLGDAILSNTHVRIPARGRSNRFSIASMMASRHE